MKGMFGRTRRQANGMTLAQVKANLAATLAATYYERHAMPPNFPPLNTYSNEPRMDDFERMVDVLFERLPLLGLEIVATQRVDANTVALIRLTDGEDEPIPTTEGGAG